MQSNCLGKDAKLLEWHRERLGKTSHSKHLQRISNGLERICQFLEWDLTPRMMILRNRQFQNFAIYLDKNCRLLEFLRRLRLVPRLPKPNCLNSFAWWLILLLFLNWFMLPPNYQKNCQQPKLTCWDDYKLLFFFCIGRPGEKQNVAIAE